MTRRSGCRYVQRTQRRDGDHRRRQQRQGELLLRHIQHGGQQGDGKGSSGRGNDDDDIRIQRQGVADFDERGDGQRD